MLESRFMSSIFSRLGAMHFALAALLALCAWPTMATAIEAGDRGQIETVIKEYLLANPEILIEMQKALEAKQQAARGAAQAKTLAEMKDRIFNSKYQIEFGAKDAPITVVEFFDYNCGFCQRALGDMQKLLETHKNIRFVLKEFPVLGEASVETHKVTLAFNQLMPQKAAEMHLALLGSGGRKDGTVAMAKAIELGANEAALKAEMEKPHVMEAMKEVYDMANGLGINGTPSYVIGNEVVYGAVGFDQLNVHVANMRACGKAVC